nr:MAG TPA: hypothetical protein [Caudoviricetes sp.]
MDRFCFVAIMLFAMQRNMVNCSIVDVINEIDRERDILSRADLLELEFADATWKHNVHDVSFGIYDKYFDNQTFLDRIWPI